MFFGLALWVLFDWLHLHAWSNHGHVWILSSIMMLVFLAVVWVFDGKALMRGVTKLPE